MTASFLCVRRNIIAGFATLIVMVAGIGTWSATSNIAGAIVATGQVQVDQRRQVIQHPDGGVVDEISVRDGDNVVAGQLLLRLDGDMLRSELAIVDGQYYEILARRARLEAERANNDEIQFSPELVSAGQDPTVAPLIVGQTELFHARAATAHKTLEKIARQIDQINAQIDGLDAQHAAVATQITLINTELAGQRTLFEKGLTQASKVLALEREGARLAGQDGALASTRAQAEARITELEMDRLRQISLRQEQAENTLRDTDARALELAERRRSLAGRIQRLDLRAPVAGIVYGMSVTTPRAVIRAADPVLYIIPQDRPLVIEARLSPLNIDEARLGGPVTVRFPALASRQTPELQGTLTLVSADIVTDPATGASYYRAEVVLTSGEEAKLAPRILLPGMPTEVFIRTGDRSPLSYLLKPFTDYFTRAFREQ